MDQVLDISEVARLTGLSSRALRFYEARGLVKPLRTASPEMMRGAKGFWQSRAAFQGEVKPPFSSAAMNFIRAASAAGPG